MSAATNSHIPIVRVRFSASAFPRKSRLVQVLGAAIIKQPVNIITI